MQATPSFHVCEVHSSSSIGRSSRVFGSCFVWQKHDVKAFLQVLHFSKPTRILEKSRLAITGRIFFFGFINETSFIWGKENKIKEQQKKTKTNPIGSNGINRAAKMKASRIQVAHVSLQWSPFQRYHNIASQLVCQGGAVLNVV